MLAVACGETEEGDSGAADTATATEGDAEITGEWRGRLEQKGLKPFVVTAEIRDLDRPEGNTVHYTRIDCSGHWSYLGKDGRGYRFRETIDRGEGGTCTGTGVVVVTPISADRLDYSFTGGGVRSEGVLDRMR